jgi:hypothetical protein
MPFSVRFSSVNIRSTVLSSGLAEAASKVRGTCVVGLR